MKFFILILSIFSCLKTSASSELNSHVSCLKELDRVSFFERNYDIYFFETENERTFYSFEIDRLGYYDILDLEAKDESKYYQIKFKTSSNLETEYYFLWKDFELNLFDKEKFNEDFNLKSFSIFNRTMKTLESKTKENLELHIKKLLISLISDGVERLQKFLIANQFDTEYKLKVKRAKIFCEKLKNIDEINQAIKKLEI